MRGRLAAALALAWSICGAAPSQAGDLVQVRMGTPLTVVVGATFFAKEKGYFRDAGIDLQIEVIDGSSDVMAVLASNRLQVVEGGLAVSYFNAIAKNLPIILAMERSSTPIGHNLMIRPDLAATIKTVADLKGRSVVINAKASIVAYEVGKILESGGLTLKDVDVKYIPFGQTSVAFANKAADAALLVPPFVDQLANNGLAQRWIDVDDIIRPTPFVASVHMINTDWAKANPEVAANFFYALLRGVRDYCQAYHHGSIRPEMIKVMTAAGIERDPAALEKLYWSSRAVDGRINVASILDVQKWAVKEGMAATEFPADRLIDNSYVERASARLGPFVVENKDSTLKGCR